MQGKSQWKMQEELEKALAVEYAKKYCIEHGLSIEKLQMQRFVLSANECCFAQPSGVKPKGLTNDKETMPKVTLIIKFVDGQLQIEETEYTVQFLKGE